MFSHTRSLQMLVQNKYVKNQALINRTFDILGIRDDVLLVGMHIRPQFLEGREELRLSKTILDYSDKLKSERERCNLATREDLVFVCDYRLQSDIPKIWQMQFPFLHYAAMQQIRNMDSVKLLGTRVLLRVSIDQELHVVLKATHDRPLLHSPVISNLVRFGETFEDIVAFNASKIKLDVGIPPISSPEAFAITRQPDKGSLRYNLQFQAMLPPDTDKQIKQNNLEGQIVFIKTGAKSLARFLMNNAKVIDAGTKRALLSLGFRLHGQKFEDSLETVLR